MLCLSHTLADHSDWPRLLLLLLSSTIPHFKEMTLIYMAPNRSSSTTIKLKSMKLCNETDIDNTETLIDNYNKKVF